MKKISSKFSKLALGCLTSIAIMLISFLGVFSAPLMDAVTVLAEMNKNVSSTLTVKNFQKSAKLGADVKVPYGTVAGDDANANVIIKNPNGKVIFNSKTTTGESVVTKNDTEKVYTFKADKIGVYRVEYSMNEGVNYRALQTQTYEIVVTGEKATMSFEEDSKYLIPSKTNANYQIVLPNPSVKSSEGKELTEAQVLSGLEVRVKSSIETEWKSSELASDEYFIKKVVSGDTYHYAFTPSGDLNCTYTINYIYTDAVTGLETQKVFTVEYEKDFNAEDIEFGYNLSGSMPESFELGVETTLPSVSYYDENDSNLTLVGHTDVEVVFIPNESAKANYENKESVLVSNSRTFTPIYSSKDGYYKITYKLADFYNYSQNKVNKTLTYTVSNAKDSTAPVTYVVRDYDPSTIDEDYEIVNVSYKIPTKIRKGQTVNFPAIYATDEVSALSEITLNRVIVPETGSNITLEKIEKSEGVKYTYNETASYTFNEVGTYTIRYEATDKANKYNYSGTTFTIVVEEDFEDNKAPTIKMTSLPAVLNAGEEYTFEKPTVVDYASDDGVEVVDTNPEIYYIYYASSVSEDTLNAEIAKIRKGEESNVVKVCEEVENDSTKLKIVALGEDFKVACVAYDDANYINSDNGRSIATREIKVKNPEADTTPATIQTNDADYVNAITTLNTTLNQNEVINIPTLNVEDGLNTVYLQASVNVFDKDGKVIKVRNASYTTDGSTYTISNAKFTAIKKGEYTIVYTITDLGGSYVVKSFTLTVNDTVAPTITQDGALSTVEVFTPTKIPAITVMDDGKEIEPSSMEIIFVGENPEYEYNIGSREFTAKETGTFSYKYSVSDGINTTESEVFTFVAQDTTKPELNVDTELVNLEADNHFELEKETGLETYKKIILPGFNSFDKSGIKEEKVTVKFPSGTTKDAEKDEVEGTYKFEPTANGAYTVVYSATDNSNLKTEKTFTIYVGDVEGPSINISSEIKQNKKEYKTGSNLSLDLTKISITDNKDAQKTALELTEEYYSGSQRFSVTITGPDGNEITAKEGTDYQYTLTDAGKYTITYTAIDKAGNKSIKTEYVQVNAEDSTSVVSTETWSIVLIVASLAVLAGIVIYFVKTRDKKSTRNEARNEARKLIENNKEDENK